MNKQELALADTRTQIAAAMFKPVPGGYVFCEPYRLPFTQSPHYLVNEAQKDQILATIVPKRPILWQVTLWSAICVMAAVAGIAFWPYTRHGDTTLTDMIGMIVLTFVLVLVAFVLLRWRTLRGLRPLLASLPTTDLRITRSDAQRQVTDAMSTRQLILVVAAAFIACSSFLINAIIFLMMGRSVGFLYLAGGLLFGAPAIVYCRRLIDRVGNALPKPPQAHDDTGRN